MTDFSREITQIGLLLDLLAERVGGPVVASNLVEDLEVAPVVLRDGKPVMLIESCPPASGWQVLLRICCSPV